MARRLRWLWLRLLAFGLMVLAGLGGRMRGLASGAPVTAEGARTGTERADG